MQSDIPVEEYESFASEPQFVAVGELNGDDFLCTATLIDPYTIITAAHCFGMGGEIEFSLGHQFRKIVGIRSAQWLVHSRSHDLAIAYLDAAIDNIDLPKLSLSRSNLRELEGHELEFAGFGAAIVAPTGLVAEEVEGVKLAGKTKGVLQSDFLIEGFFRYNERRDSLNAVIAEGDSGAPLFVRQKDQSYGIVGVLTRGPPAYVYGGEWAAVLLAGHSNFIEKAMAYKEIETRPDVAIWRSDWDDPTTWRRVSDKNNFEERVNDTKPRHSFDDNQGNGLDSTEDMRRFSVNVSGNVALNRHAEVTHFKVHRGGELALSREARLDAKSVAVQGGELTFVIGDVSHAQLRAEGLEFADATLNIDFQSHRRNALDRDSILKQPNWVDSDRSISSSLISGTFELLTSYMKKPKLKREWTIVSSSRYIRGKPVINFRNVPERSDVEVRQDGHSITVQLFEK